METKKGKGKNIVIVILIVLLLGALGYIAYDKIIKTDEPIKTEEKNDKKSNDETTSNISNDNFVGAYIAGTYFDGNEESLPEPENATKEQKYYFELILKQDGSAKYTEICNYGNGYQEEGTYDIKDGHINFVSKTCEPDHNCLDKREFKITNDNLVVNLGDSLEYALTKTSSDNLKIFK